MVILPMSAGGMGESTATLLQPESTLLCRETPNRLMPLESGAVNLQVTWLTVTSTLTGWPTVPKHHLSMYR